MTTLNLTTSANESDTHAGSGINNGGKRPGLGTVSDGSLLAPGSHGNNDEYSAAVRFTGVTIPQAATINSADFSWRATATYSAGASVIKLKVCLQAADNAGALATSGSTDLDGATRAGTTADADWTVTSVTGGTRYTVSLTAAVQEVINRAGWASGNAVVVLIDTHIDCTQGEWQDFDPFNTAGATNGPKLDIDYTAGAGTYTLSGTGTIPVPTGGGAGLQYTSLSALSGTGTVAVPSGSGAGLTYRSLSDLSGTGTIAVPSGSGAGLTFTNPVFTLSGTGTVAVPSGSGTGLTFTPAAGTFTLSGGGTVPVPSGSGTGLTYRSLSTLSGGGTVAVPTGGGAGLAYRSLSSLSGTAAVAVPSGSGVGLAVVNPAYTLSGTGTLGAPSGSGTGLLFFFNLAGRARTGGGGGGGARARGGTSGMARGTGNGGARAR